MWDPGFVIPVNVCSFLLYSVHDAYIKLKKIKKKKKKKERERERERAGDDARCGMCLYQLLSTAGRY